MSERQVLGVLLVLILMVASLTVHEFAHALAGKLLGDDTAERHGRLTLNPLAHIDPFGTLLLPGLCMFAGAPFFGWARPTPYDPSRFRPGLSPRLGSVLVAAAGPLSNLLLAVACALAVHAVPDARPGGAGAMIDLLGRRLVEINVGLAIFNLLPVPPLDGSGVVAGLLPPRLGRAFIDGLQRYGIIVFALVLFGAGRLLAKPVDATLRLLGM